MQWRKVARTFWEEELGQTSVEYMLVGLLIVTIVMQLKSKLGGVILKVFGKLDGSIDKLTDDSDFSVN